MTQYRFDADTAGDLLDSSTLKVGLNPQWNVDGRILNGGYLQAVAVRAACTVVGESVVPVAVSTGFAAAAQPGGAVAHVEILRAGSRMTSAAVTLRQSDAAILSCVITLRADDGEVDGQLDGAEQTPRKDAAAETPSSLTMPAVSGPDAGIRVPAEQLPGPPGLAQLVDFAFVPESSAWLAGDTSAGPHIRCWMSFADGRPLDALAAIAMVDMAPPVCFGLGQFGWAPTLQLQVGLFAQPNRGPFLLDVHGEPYDGAVVAEDGLLWDADGTLIARSRQIALAPRG